MATANKEEAFTFLELIFVLAIVAILAAIVIPNFRQPVYERKQFIDHLNALLQVSWQDAIVTNKLHKISFDFDKNLISVDVQTDKKAANDDFIYKPMSSKYLNATYKWPSDRFEFKNFYINKRDEMVATLKNRQSGKIWFFMVPDGLAQPVIINIVDTKDRDRKFSLVLNPFTAKFSEYDVFKKP